ncbi:MAG: diphthine--ammonia ligase [Dehalococcoidales bacterium]
MSQVFVSWSGGKECNLAGYRARKSGLEICYLANMVTEDGARSRTHGLSAEILRLQSQAMGIPLVQRQATWQSYEVEFKKMVNELKKEGIDGGVFGDIDLDEHREWVERVCREVGITAHQPVWGESQDDILKDFINSGFKAIIVATRADMLGEEWLGRSLDMDFFNEIKELGRTRGITPCGEAGEYHTLVIDGPLFQKKMEITEAKKVFRDKHWFLEILSAELRAK